MQQRLNFFPLPQGRGRLRARSKGREASRSGGPSWKIRKASARPA